MKDPLSKYNDPKLYRIAKEITLGAGFPYTDPRTGETTQPPKKGNKMSNSKKIPQWVLLDEIHVGIHIKTDMPEKDRKILKAMLAETKELENIMWAFIVPTAGLWNKVKVKVTR
jgi:hypothetical protein